MFRHSLIVLVVAALLLAACGPQMGAPVTTIDLTALATHAPTAYPQSIEPGSAPGAYPYPEPEIIPLPPPPYPQPGQPPATPWAPANGDKPLQRANVFIDQKQILVLESFPPQYRLQLSGNLPTPCHQLRVEVNPPDRQKRIQVQVYSLVDPEMICVQMLQPFDTSVSLGGGLATGTYSIWLDDEQVGEIEVP